MAASVSEVSTLSLLARVPLFSSLDPKQLRTILRSAKERLYPAGASIVQRGDRGIGFYLVLGGSVEVQRNGKAVARLGPGQFFGEMALFDDQPRTADVVAEKGARCLVLSPWEFWSTVGQEPDALKRLLRETVRRLRICQEAATV